MALDNGRGSSGATSAPPDKNATGASSDGVEGPYDAPPLVASPLDVPRRPAFPRHLYEPLQQGQLGPLPSAEVSGAGVDELGDALAADAKANVDATAGKVGSVLAGIQMEAIVTVSTPVSRAPFSQHGIAERLATDPEFYQRLARYVAEELAREIVRRSARLPNERAEQDAYSAITAEVVRFRVGFEHAASELEAAAATDPTTKAKALERAADAIVGIRDGFAAWCENHSEFVSTFTDMAVVVLASYTLHQFAGTSGDIAALISCAVVRKERLTDVLQSWSAQKKRDE